MLKRTEKKITIGFGLIVFMAVTYFAYSTFSSNTALIPGSNKYLKNISFYFTPHRPDAPVNAIIAIDWFKKMNKASVTDKTNYTVEMVKIKDKKWQKVEGGKSCRINFLQHVYAPYVDTEAKRKKAKPEERDRKITQLFLDIEPKADTDDFYRVLVTNVIDEAGNKMTAQEYAVVKVNELNKLFLR